MAVIFAHRQGFAECLADGLDAPYGILGRAMETAASSKPAKRHCPTRHREHREVGGRREGFGRVHSAC